MQAEIPLYEADGDLCDWISPARMERLEKLDLIQIVRHKKGRVSRCALAAAPGGSGAGTRCWTTWARATDSANPSRMGAGAGGSGDSGTSMNCGRSSCGWCRTAWRGVQAKRTSGHVSEPPWGELGRVAPPSLTILTILKMAIRSNLGHRVDFDAAHD